jgi:hypothetical protein
MENVLLTLINMSNKMLYTVANISTTHTTNIMNMLNTSPILSLSSSRTLSPRMKLIDVSVWDDELSIERTRFTINDIRYIIRSMCLPSYIITDNNTTVDILTVMCILLRRLAYPVRLNDMVIEFGVEKTLLSRILSKITELLIFKYNDFIELWPGINQRSIQHYSTLISSVYPAVSSHRIASYHLIIIASPFTIHHVY